MDKSVRSTVIKKAGISSGSGFRFSRFRMSSCAEAYLFLNDGAIIIASVDGEFTMKYLRKGGKRIYPEAADPFFSCAGYSFPGTW